MHKVIITVLMMVLAGCALGTPTDEPIDEPVITPDAPDFAAICEQRGYVWDETEALCTFTQEGNPAITIQYPTPLAQYPFIIDTVNSYIDTYLETFLDAFEESGADSPGPWTLDLSYDLYELNSNIISILWTETFYTGGANVALEYTTAVYDVDSSAVVNFIDMFVEDVVPLDVVMPPTREQLAIKLDGISDEASINAGTDELSDYLNFVLNDTELIIFFEPYTVAAGAAGPQQVELPLGDLADVLQPEYQLVE